MPGLSFLSKKSWHTSNLKVRSLFLLNSVLIPNTNSLSLTLTLILTFTVQCDGLFIITTIILLLQNVEKVWIAEQKAEQEEKKLLELQKQLEEERQIQELRQLQAQSHGTVHHSVDSSMDWMYEGPAAAQASQQQKAAEEYLLGKIYKPQENKTFELGLSGKR